jgi:hypothetical protein
VSSGAVWRPEHGMTLGSADDCQPLYGLRLTLSSSHLFRQLVARPWKRLSK